MVPSRSLLISRASEFGTPSTALPADLELRLGLRQTFELEMRRPRYLTGTNASLRREHEGTSKIVLPFCDKLFVAMSIIPRNWNGGDMKSFLTGLGTGLAIGIFVAPQRGSETRRRIANKAGELGDRAGERVNRLKQAAGDPQKLIGKVKRQTKAYRARVEDAASNATEKVKEAAQSLASKAGVGPLAMLNTGSREDLLRVYGIGPVLADKIINGRPYTSEREVVEREILSESTLKELQRSLKSA